MSLFPSLVTVIREELISIKLDQDFSRLGVALGSLMSLLEYWDGLSEDYEDLISFIGLLHDSYSALSDDTVYKNLNTLIRKLDDMIQD
jgi:hypothetical protein